MKKNLLVAFLLLQMVNAFSQTQNVGIGTTTPDASAILDLTSNNKGFLAPRLTTAQRTSIAAPAVGLLVYDVNIGCYFYYNTAWVSLCQLSGPTGAQGNPGITGPAGATGAPGLPGASGTIGVNGATGAQGPIGVTGANGTPGATGQPGAPGATGPQGATGLQGNDGPTGLQGIPGIAGPTGPQGLQGNDGPTGAQGIQGVTGSQGDIGATGPQGPQGTPGINAASGSQGAPGATGLNGATGPTGPQGIQGITGAQGNQGVQGATGAQGNQGNQGVQGITGAQGIPGVTGAQGVHGITGDVGATGLQGIQGITGSQGIQGATGAIGATGAVGATGFLQPGGVFTMPYYNASIPAWITTATNIYDNGTNVAMGPVGGTTVATTTEKLTVLGAAISGLNVTTTSTTTGQYALHANGSSFGDAYLGYINPTLTISGEVVSNPTGYFTSAANVPLAVNCIGGSDPALVAINSAAAGGQAAFLLSNNPATDGMDITNNAAAGTNVGDGIFSYTAQSSGFSFDGYNGNTNGTAAIAIGNDLTFGYYLPAGSGGAFSGSSTGAVGFQLNGLTAGTNYLNADAGLYGQDTINSTITSLRAMYHFGVWGINNDGSAGYGTRSGGVMGSTTLSNTFGAIAYTAANDVLYGIYYTAGTSGSGNGFLPSSNVYGIGSGGTGGIIGSWTRGAVMGQVNCGELFASYNLGNSYTSGYQAELVDAGDKRVAAFSVTSADVKVYGDGNAALQNGSATVKFDASFAAMLGATPNVTVTPIGESNGLFIVSMDKTGFTVKENKGGQSNIQFTWIAVGNRIDAANKPALPADLADKNFDANMKGVMFDESDLEHTGNPVWWDGQKVRFDRPTGTVFHMQKSAPTVKKKMTKKSIGKGAGTTSNK